MILCMGDLHAVFFNVPCIDQLLLMDHDCVVGMHGWYACMYALHTRVTTWTNN